MDPSWLIVAPSWDDVTTLVDACLIGIWLFGRDTSLLIEEGETSLVPIFYRIRRRFGEMLF